MLIIAHSGNAGHRGAEATAAELREEVPWASLSQDAHSFTSNCIHCLMLKSGHKIPRPFSLTLHATRSILVVYFDYMYIGPSSPNLRSIFVVKDDLSSYIWLIPCSSPDAATAARELVGCVSSLQCSTGSMNSHISSTVTCICWLPLIISTTG